jgi:hypothetical protein
MARILSKLRIDEISSVDRGAGEGVKVVLMKRDAPPQGSVREKLQFLIERLRRGYPHMPLRQARSEAWNALSDDEQIELLREEQQNMNKLDSSEVFADWWRQLDVSERRRYRAQQALIDAEMAAEGSGGDGTSGRGGSQFNGRPSSPNIAPGAPKAPTFAKGDDLLQNLFKQFGVVAVAHEVAKSGDARHISEAEMVQEISHYAATKGTTVGKLLNSNTGEANMLAKACQVCRDGARARQAERNLFDARMRHRG